MFTLLLALVASVAFSGQAAFAANATPSVALLAPAGVQNGQVVSLRYKTRVHYNFSDPRHGNRKILFSGPTVWPRPLNGSFYTLQANVTSEGFRYLDDAGCADGPPGTPPGVSELQLAIADWPGQCPGGGICPLSNVCPGGGPVCKGAHIGMKANDLTIFPRFVSGTDGNHTLSILHARSQLDLNDAEVSSDSTRATPTPSPPTKRDGAIAGARTPRAARAATRCSPPGPTGPGSRPSPSTSPTGHSRRTPTST
jgi:hypothetical protein